MNFLAIDFETADYGGDSACAVGLVRTENGILVKSESHLIKPPRSEFVFTYIHGITKEDVRDAPTFGELWMKIAPMFSGIDFLVAHNAGFDRNVLSRCCEGANIPKPDIPFRCTMVLARKTWGIYPTKLPDVCRRFGIPLRHHDALSDTQACAQIMLKVLAEEVDGKRGTSGRSRE